MQLRHTKFSEIIARPILHNLYKFELVRSRDGVVMQFFVNRSETFLQKVAYELNFT